MRFTAFMLFNSFNFILLFLPLVLVVALSLKGQALLRWLTVASFIFYAFAGQVWFLIPMLITTVLDFYLAPFIAEARIPWRKRLLLIVSLCGNLGLLFYFKYSGLLVQTVMKWHLLFGGSASQTPGWLSYFDVILPAGISFYTFQTISYVIDVYQGRAQPELNFWKFAGFVSFFPHLVAGPLTRHHQLLPALAEIAESGIKPRWREGVFLFSVGLSKKVLIADRISPRLNPMLLDIGALGLPTAWLALLGFSLQIYFDFSGYSDMAIGLGRMFGIELPQNFNSPYQAVNPSDFWKRWHMTLSAWLRDYLYIALGGGRCSPARRCSNLMITMILGGLWHGANWNFALWGGYHGLLLVIYHLIEPTWNRWHRGIQRTITFALVNLGWVFFRTENFSQARIWFSKLFGLGGLALSSWGHDQNIIASRIFVCLALVQFMRNASSYDGWKNIPRSAQFALGLMTTVAILFIADSSKFLYFQF